MQSTRFELVQCWQDERVDQVLNKEAASVDRATFLATHMPMQHLDYQHEVRHVASGDEETFLRELHRCAAANLHTFAVVQGIPGTGKSHLIRWLKERYRTPENQQRECILFIERARASLSGTLEQIIRSDAFDAVTMREQLEKLRGARIALSQDALADTLLDQLRIGCTEDPSLDVPRWLLNGDNLQLFLLDYRVREELKKPGGPIDRLVRFLRTGPGPGIAVSEAPRFEEGDFDFKARVREDIQGYQRARDLADRLSGDGGRERRLQLASLLNQAIRYAVGHATALTGDDFKRVFADLRCSLARQGRSLALFIEDITVLTGVDRGLLDVLVTQHTGEGEQELCRLISVVGITDSYYRDQVPDNIKERMSYHIALSAENTSLELGDTRALANLASRYLNAMRLPRPVLETWAEQSMAGEDLPNACQDCPWRETCHQAFGFHTLNPGSADEQRIGLYPLNDQALSTLYQHIDLSRNRRTQRSFLSHVLHYLLQSHATRLKQRAFPPALADLGGEFTGFSLLKPLQRELLHTQSGSDAGRVITLLAIWGNGTADTIHTAGGTTLVGGLPREVFRAFGLPTIAGESSGRVLQQEPTAAAARSELLVAPAPAPHKVEVRPPAPEVPDVRVAQVSEKLKKYHDDLASWIDGGALRYYEEYAEALAAFIRSGIDWSAYGISQFQVQEVLRGRRNLCIEGQVGQTSAAYIYALQRTSELHYVLQGLIELKESGPRMPPALLSGYLGHCSLWLHRHEADLVAFVRRPNQASPEALPLVQIVVLDCVLLACLQGELATGYRETQTLFRDLIRFCQRTRADTAHWEAEVRQASESHADLWVRLMRRLKPEDIKNLCEDCLQLLNCAQGDSSEVKFVDAATGIRILEAFRQNAWRLPEAGLAGKTSRLAWVRAMGVFETLQKMFAGAVQGEQAEIQEQLRRLGFHVERDTYQEVFRAIEQLVQACRRSQRGLAFEQNSQLRADLLQAAVAALQPALAAGEGEEVILRSARAGRHLGIVKTYIEYFRTFRDAAASVLKSSEARLAQLGQEAQGAPTREEAQHLYHEVVQTLLACKQTGEQL